MHNIHTVQVLWPDCDPAGILFNVSYYRWMDDAAFYLFEKAGLPWDELKTRFGVPGVPLVSSHADFRSPAKFRDRLAADGWERRIWCHVDPDDPANITLVRVPDDVRKALGG